MAFVPVWVIACHFPFSRFLGRSLGQDCDQTSIVLIRLRCITYLPYIPITLGDCLLRSKLKLARVFVGQNRTIILTHELVPSGRPRTPYSRALSPRSTPTIMAAEPQTCAIRTTMHPVFSSFNPKLGRFCGSKPDHHFNPQTRVIRTTAHPVFSSFKP